MEALSRGPSASGSPVGVPYGPPRFQVDPVPKLEPTRTRSLRPRVGGSSPGWGILPQGGGILPQGAGCHQKHALPVQRVLHGTSVLRGPGPMMWWPVCRPERAGTPPAQPVGTRLRTPGPEVRSLPSGQLHQGPPLRALPVGTPTPGPCPWAPPRGLCPWACHSALTAP